LGGKENHSRHISETLGREREREREREKEKTHRCNPTRTQRTIALCGFKSQEFSEIKKKKCFYFTMLIESPLSRRNTWNASRNSYVNI
jgi:hypothetical protein